MPAAAILCTYTSSRPEARDRLAKAWRAPWGVTIISRTPAPSTRCRHCSAVGLDRHGEPELARRGDGLRRAAHPPERQHLDAVAAQQRDALVVVEHVLDLALVRDRRAPARPARRCPAAGRSRRAAQCASASTERPARARRRPARGSGSWAPTRGPAAVADRDRELGERSPAVAEERADHRLAQPGDRLAQRLGVRGAGHRERRDEHHHERVDVVRPAGRARRPRRGPPGLTVVPASTGSPASTRSSPCRASTTSRFSAVELPTTATRPPAGSGWVASSWAVSNICVTFAPGSRPSARTAPARASRPGATGRRERQPARRGRRSSARS